MRSTMIHNTNIFNLTSYGRGVSYCFTHKTQCREVFVQGDDATEFRNTWERIDASDPEASLDHVLYRLWDVYADASEPSRFAVERDG